MKDLLDTTKKGEELSSSVQLLLKDSKIGKLRSEFEEAQSLFSSLSTLKQQSSALDSQKINILLDQFKGVIDKLRLEIEGLEKAKTALSGANQASFFNEKTPVLITESPPSDKKLLPPISDMKSRGNSPGNSRKSIFESITESIISKRDQYLNNHKDPFISGNFLLRRVVSGTYVFKTFPISPNAPSIRTQLPAMVPSELVQSNIRNIAKKYIGRESLKVTQTVAFSSPISSLQFFSSFLKYYELIDKANQSETPEMRVALILANFLMAVSTFAEETKKPMKPLLGETYEWTDGKIKIFSEQVSENPSIAALHAETEDFELDSTFEMNEDSSILSFKDWMKSKIEIRLKGYTEMYKVYFPKLVPKNVVFGKQYLWIKSSLNVQCSSGLIGKLEFLPPSNDLGTKFSCVGTVFDQNRPDLLHLSGKWNKNIFCSSQKISQKTLLAERVPEIPKWEDQFYFDSFLVNANNLTLNMLTYLPSSDSRLRTDIRAYENRQIELAESEKNRLEQRQKEIKRQMVLQQKEWIPKWFANTTVDDMKYRYNYKYWKCRADGQWPEDMLDLFSEDPINLESYSL